MRRVLIVTYSFLPLHSVGVRQFVGYCRYLPEFGWQATVLTKDWDRDGLAPEDAHETLTPAPELGAKLEGRASVATTRYRTKDNPYLRVHERLQALTARPTASNTNAALKVARRAWSLGYPVFGHYPDGQVGWASTAVKRGTDLVQRNDISAIVSNCPPVTNSVVASQISRNTGIPWVPYFGDLYTFDLSEHQSYPTSLHRAYASRLHRRLMRPAAACFAVSPGIVDYVRDTYGVDGDVVVVGYDEEDFPAKEIHRSSVFAIAHVGSLYGDQRVEVLLDALDLLVERCPALKETMQVRLVGSRRDAEIRSRVSDRPCSPLVSIEAKVAPDEAIAIQRNSEVLLLFPFDAPWNKTSFGTYSYPSKIFEYFGAERRVLTIPGDGDWVDNLLHRTGAGVSAAGSEKVASVLLRWYDEWAHTGDLPWRGDRNVVREFTHRAQAEVMARRLDVVSTVRP